MKEYSTFPKTPELEPQHQMKFSAISGTLVDGRFLTLSRDAVCIFYNPKWLDSGQKYRKKTNQKGKKGNLKEEKEREVRKRERGVRRKERNRS